MTEQITLTRHPGQLREAAAAIAPTDPEGATQLLRIAEGIERDGRYVEARPAVLVTFVPPPAE